MATAARTAQEPADREAATAQTTARGGARTDDQGGGQTAEPLPLSIRPRHQLTTLHTSVHPPTRTHNARMGHGTCDPDNACVIAQ